jgi:formate/nitrite transporter FocA (FNT family)
VGIVGKNLIISLTILLIANLALAKSSIYDPAVKPYASPNMGPVKMHQSNVDKYIDVVADKIAPSVIGNIIGGPTGLALKIASKLDSRANDAQE